MKDVDLILFLKGLSAWIEKEKQLLDQLQALIKDFSTRV